MIKGIFRGSNQVAAVCERLEDDKYYIKAYEGKKFVDVAIIDINKIRRELEKDVRV